VDDRWIEAVTDGRRQTEESCFYDEAWLDRDWSAKSLEGSCPSVPPRLRLSGSELRGLFARYPALYALPALALGTCAFVLVVHLLIQ